MSTKSTSSGQITSRNDKLVALAIAVFPSLISIPSLFCVVLMNALRLGSNGTPSTVIPIIFLFCVFASLASNPAMTGGTASEVAGSRYLALLAERILKSFTIATFLCRQQDDAQHCHKWLSIPWLVLAVAGICFLPVSKGSAAEPNSVGKVAEVSRVLYGTPPHARRGPKYDSDPVFFNEVLETPRSSAALVRFVDGSLLTLGADSQVKIDEFVFDSENGVGDASISIMAGTLRFVTGEMPKGATHFQTPTATMTIRGTNLAIKVSPNGDTLVTVREGIVAVLVNDAAGTKQSIEISADQSLQISKNRIATVSGEMATGDGVVDAIGGAAGAGIGQIQGDGHGHSTNGPPSKQQESPASPGGAGGPP